MASLPAGAQPMIATYEGRFLVIFVVIFLIGFMLLKKSFSNDNKIFYINQSVLFIISSGKAKEPRKKTKL